MTAMGTGRGTAGMPPPVPVYARPARRSPAWTRFTGALLVVLSLISALTCRYVFATWLPSDVERYRDYLAAEPCPAHTTAAEREDCLRAVPFTVVDTEVKSAGKSSKYEATLHGAPFWNGTVAFGNPGPLLEQLRPGDRVTGTVWRGDIVVVGKGSVRQSTSEEPRDEPQMAAAIGTFTGMLAVLGLGFGVRRLAGSHGRDPFTWRTLGKPLFITMVVVCAVVGFTALRLDSPWWVVPAISVPAVSVPAMAYAAWLFYRYRRHRWPAARS